jgi:hypothetical protein
MTKKVKRLTPVSKLAKLMKRSEASFGQKALAHCFLIDRANLSWTFCLRTKLIASDARSPR